MAKKNSSSIDSPPKDPPRATEQEEASIPLPAEERQVTNFYGPESLDATPKEIRQKYRDTVSSAENMAVTDMNEQQERVKQTSKEYFAAVRADQKARGAGSKILEDLTGLEGNKKSTKLLRNQWLRSRAHFAFTQSEALDERLKNRPKTREDVLEGLKKHKGKGSLDEAKVRARYERMVTVRTVVMGAEEAELAVKMEGLNERDKTSLDRFYDRYKKLPPAVRIFGTSAAILGLTSGAGVLLGGAMIGVVPLGMAGSAAALRFFSEKSTNERVKRWLSKFSYAASVGGAFGALMNYGVTKAHRALGTERKAQEVLGKNDRLGMLSDVSNLENISQKRKKSLVVRDSIARQGRWARIAGSVGAGALFGHLFGHGTSSHENVEALTSPDTSTAASPAPHEAPDVAISSSPAGASVLEQVPVVEPHSVSIQPGEGMDKLFVELREHYGKLYPDSTDPSVPPGIRHLLEAESGNELSRELHFINDNDASYVMKVGDSLGFNEEGALVFTMESDPTAHVVLLENNADGTLQIHALSTEEQQGHFLSRTEALVAAAPTASVETGPVPPHEQNITAQFNKDAVGGHPIDSPVVAHETLPIHETVAESETTYVPEHVADKVPPVDVVPPVPAHPEPIPPVTSEAPSVEHTPPIVDAGQPFINGYEVSVSPLETHAYSVVDEASPNGEQLVVFGGGDARDEAFLSRVQEIARENPGRKVYFDAGYPVDYNGVPQRWINSVVFDPENGISMGITPEGPEMIGTINPDSFINKVT